MTTQITVRLPDHLVEYLDTQVRAGDAASRAAAVARAIERERRHHVAMEDARIYAAASDDADLAAFTARAAANSPALD
ncbi:MAG: antitoxin [Actinobacteria bacterium HGW-Actinobacteria-4]|nr:MAG: antitoxin [Actinobacteria bacterium HGW-Actinobacteria-4]